MSPVVLQRTSFQWLAVCVMTVLIRPAGAVHGYQPGALMHGCMLMQVAFSYNLMDELVPLYASAAVDLGGIEAGSQQPGHPLDSLRTCHDCLQLLGLPAFGEGHGNSQDNALEPACCCSPESACAHDFHRHWQHACCPFLACRQLLLHQGRLNLSLHMLYGPGRSLFMTSPCLRHSFCIPMRSTSVMHFWWQQALLH